MEPIIHNYCMLDVVIGYEDENKQFQIIKEFPKESRPAFVKEQLIFEESLSFCYEEKPYKTIGQVIRLVGVENLPEPQPNTYLIVNQLIVNYLAEMGLKRDDLICSYSEKMYYDKDKKALGVPGLVRYAFDNQTSKDKASSIQKRVNREFEQVRNLGFLDFSFGEKVNDTVQKTLTIPAEKSPAKIENQEVEIGRLGMIPLYTLKRKEIQNLPTHQTNTLILTSAPVAQMCTEQTNVYAGRFNETARVHRVFSALVRYVV